LSAWLDATPRGREGGRAWTEGSRHPARKIATAILAAVADGEISAEAGDRLLRMLDTYGKAVVLDEHERRLQAIEGSKTINPALPYETRHERFGHQAPPEKLETARQPIRTSAAQSWPHATPSRRHAYRGSFA